MRFGSYKDFTQFLKGLSDIGYLIPFTDYEKEMNIKGFKKHIHNYECKIEGEETDQIKLVFTDNKTGIYTDFMFNRRKNNG